MELGHVLHLELSHRMELDYIGGITESVFTMTESKLLESSHLQRCLKNFLKPILKYSKDYRSYMDFLYVHVFPGFKPICHLYYATDNEDLMLRNIITQDSIKTMDEFFTNHILRFAEEMDKTVPKFRIRGEYHWVDIISDMLVRNKLHEFDNPLRKMFPHSREIYRTC